MHIPGGPDILKRYLRRERVRLGSISLNGRREARRAMQAARRLGVDPAKTSAWEAER
jgi:hypothetical protein